MKLKLDRIISIATLAASLIAIVLVLKKPAPVAHPQTPAAVAANAQSFGQKMDALEQAAQQAPPASSAIDQGAPSSAQQTAPAIQKPSALPKAEVHINSDEVAAALTQALGVAGTSASLRQIRTSAAERPPSRINKSALKATSSTDSFSPRLPAKTCG